MERGFRPLCNSHKSNRKGFKDLGIGFFKRKIASTTPFCKDGHQSRKTALQVGVGELQVSDKVVALHQGSGVTEIPRICDIVGHPEETNFLAMTHKLAGSTVDKLQCTIYVKGTILCTERR